MATSVIGKIIRFERVHNRKKDAKSAFAMALTYYLGYAVSSSRDMLHKANFVLQKPDFAAELPLVFMRAFIAYEAENFDLLEEIIDQIRPRKSALKSNQPTFYAHLLYFECLLYLTNRKERAASKTMRNLKDYCEDDFVPGSDLLLANLNLTFRNYSEAYHYLLQGYKRGERSPLFFVCLARTFSESAPRGEAGELLLPLIMWSLNTGVYIDAIMMKHQHLAESVLRKAPKIAQTLYLTTPLDWILHIITTSRMINNDLSHEAFYYYKEAQARQLYFPQLHDFLMRAAHKNGIEDISGFSLMEYMKAEQSIPDSILPFIYHLVLKGKLAGRHDEMMPILKPIIIHFACECLEKRLYGKYYYSLYKYLLDVHEADGAGSKINPKYVEAALEVVKNLLFAYDVTVQDKRVTQILVREQFKKEDAVYKLKDGHCRINLWSPQVEITCLDDTKRNIFDTTAQKTRLIETADQKLYESLYNQGYTTPESLIYLAYEHINKTDENLSLIAQDIFERVKHVGICRLFLKMINAALGNFYARSGSFDQAAGYFKDLDVDAINKNYLEQMLLVYINARNYARAGQLIARLGENLSDKIVLDALKKMTPHIGTLEHKRGLAVQAAKMLSRGWFDTDLMQITLTYYIAPIGGWVELAKSLSNIGVFEPKLHEKILQTAILTHNHTKAAQNVFAQMAKYAVGTQATSDFAMYMCYEVLTNELMPEQVTIHALEQVFNHSSNRLLGYALAHIYIRQGKATSELSLTTCEVARKILTKSIAHAYEDGIIFPIFKEIKDKELLTAYIEKHSAFMYRTGTGRDIAFFYRIGQGDFTEVQMTHLAFGLYYCHVVHFYGEEIEYYFLEKRKMGSVKTKAHTILNNQAHMLENDSDLYYTINNAIVYEQMFKYDQVEEIVTAQLGKKVGIRAKRI